VVTVRKNIFLVEETIDVSLPLTSSILPAIPATSVPASFHTCPAIPSGVGVPTI
jgi:hypothetical protein